MHVIARSALCGEAIFSSIEGLLRAEVHRPRNTCAARKCRCDDETVHEKNNPIPFLVHFLSHSLSECYHTSPTNSRLCTSGYVSANTNPIYIDSRVYFRT